MTEEEEKEIIKKIKSGNKQERNIAAKMMWESEILHKFTATAIIKYKGDLSEKDFLFQETATIVYQNIVSNKFREESKLSTYFLSICERVYIKMKKKNDSDKHNENIEHDFIHDVEAAYLERERMKNIKVAAQKAYEIIGEPCKTLLKSVALGIQYEDILPNVKHLFSSVKYLRLRVFRCRKELRENSDFQNLIKKIL